MAATKLHIARSGVLDRESYPDFHDKQIVLFTKQEAKEPVLGGQFFNELNTPTMDFKITGVGSVLGMPQVSSDTDPLPFDQPGTGYSKSGTCATLRNAVRITRTLMKEDLSGGKASAMLKGLPVTHRRWFEYSYAAIFNAIASTEGADGSYLVDDDHYHIIPEAGVWSNKESSAALSTTSLNAMAVNMLDRKNERGFTMDMDLEKIIAPTALNMKAQQLHLTPTVPESSTEAVNVYKGITPVIWKNLTSATRWFGWGSLPEEMWGTHSVSFTKPIVKRLGYPSSEYPDIVSAYYLYMQCAVVASIMYNCHSNAGT